MNEKIKDITEIEKKVPLKSKIAYGYGCGAINVLGNIAFSSITYFYNTIIGLNAVLIGLVWLIFAAWNAINDPLFGALGDKTKSRFGRRIPYIRFGAPIFGLLFIFIWLPLYNPSNEWAIFIYLLVILFAFDSIYSVITLSFFILPAEMSISAKSRANILVYGNLIGALGTGISLIVPVLFLTGKSDLESVLPFLITMIIFGIIFSLLLFTASYNLYENKFTQIQEPLGFIEGFKETMKNKAYLIYVGSQFFWVLSNTILTTGVIYYVQYILNLEGIGSIIPLLCIFGMLIVFAFIVDPLLSRLGPKKFYTYSLLLHSLSFLVLFFTGWTLQTALVTLMFLGLTVASALIIGGVLNGEVLDYDELKTGKRREATYSGVNALVLKPAISIANFIFLITINFFGFQEKSRIQSDEALLGIMVAFTILPAIFLLVSALIMSFFPLEGPEWKQQKLKIAKIHEEKEKEYKSYLKEKSKNIKKKQDKTTS